MSRHSNTFADQRMRAELEKERERLLRGAQPVGPTPAQLAQAEIQQMKFRWLDAAGLSLAQMVGALPLDVLQDAAKFQAVAGLLIDRALGVTHAMFVTCGALPSNGPARQQQTAPAESPPSEQTNGTPTEAPAVVEVATS